MTRSQVWASNSTFSSRNCPRSLRCHTHFTIFFMSRSPKVPYVKPLPIEHSGITRETCFGDDRAPSTGSVRKTYTSFSNKRSTQFRLLVAHFQSILRSYLDSELRGEVKNLYNEIPAEGKEETSFRDVIDYQGSDRTMSKSGVLKDIVSCDNQGNGFGRSNR